MNVLRQNEPNRLSDISRFKVAWLFGCRRPEPRGRLRDIHPNLGLFVIETGHCDPEDPILTCRFRQPPIDSKEEELPR